MTNLPVILPNGTQVVVHIDIKDAVDDVLFASGAVGIIVRSPGDATHAYRIRLMDGSEQALKRHEFSVRSHHRNPVAPEEAEEHADLYRYVVYRCIVGSRAYGLDHEASDVGRVRLALAAHTMIVEA